MNKTELAYFIRNIQGIIDAEPMNYQKNNPYAKKRPLHQAEQYFSNNLTSRSQLFCLYYGSDDVRFCP